MLKEPSAAAQRTVRPSDPPLGRFYAVGGRRLMLHRSGAGSPPVVFLAGGGAVGLDYLNVQQRAAALTRSVLYDRAGTGWSESVARPRTSTEVTDELRDLLATAGVPPPYVLAGHSLGGLYARHYAMRFPGEVAGLLLLDPAHEDWDAYMPQPLGEMRSGDDSGERQPGTFSQSVVSFIKEVLYRFVSFCIAVALKIGVARDLLQRVPAVRRYRELYRDLFEQLMVEWPQEVREVLIERHVSLDWLWAGIQEVQNVNQLYDEVRNGGPLPDVPLIVLCSTEVDEFRRAVSAGASELLLRQEIEGKQKLYETFAQSVPRGEVRLVGGGHFTMHFRHPDAVVTAIADLLRLSLR